MVAAPSRVSTTTRPNASRQMRRQAMEHARAVAPTFLGGVRQVAPTPISLYLPNMQYTVVPRAPGREKPILDTLRLLRDYDPDASAAVWTFVRLMNSGHTVQVLSPEGTPMPDAAQLLREASVSMWKPGGGGVDVLIDTLALAFLTYGGAGAEVTLTPDLSDFDDVYPFTPGDIVFRYQKNPENGVPKLEMYPARAYGSSVINVEGQGTSATGTPLNPLQVHYQPLDPDVDDPYGRPPFLPAIPAILAMMHLIRQMQNVLTVHGYGMRDIEIDEQAVIQLAPNYLKEAGRENDLTAYVNAVRDEIEAAVKTLDPTYTFVHFNNLKINTTAAGGQGINIAPLMAELTRRMTTALKSNNMLLGSTMAREQQYATVQWQVYARGLLAIQGRVKRLIERIFNTILRIKGVNGTAHVEFGPIRETERAIELNADKVEANIWQQYYELGLISHEELSQHLVKHSPEGPIPPTGAAKFAIQFLTAAGAANFGTTWPAVQPFLPSVNGDLTSPGPTAGSDPLAPTGDYPLEPPEDAGEAPPPVEPSASAGITPAEFQQLIAVTTAILTAWQAQRSAVPAPPGAAHGR